MPNPPPSKRRLDYIDSIRALAAIGVVYLHGALALRSVAHGMGRSILYFFTEDIDPGKVGVLVFFMVSGLIIPTSFRFNLLRKISVRDFLIGRLFRLYPAYWLSMIAAFFWTYHGSFALCTPARIAMNLTMFQQFMAPQKINMIGVYWTLQIEWVFYILCIFMFLFGWLDRPSRVLRAYFACAGISFAMALVRYKTHHVLPVAVPLGLSLMFAATLWRMLILEKRQEAARHVRVAFISFALLIGPICLMAYSFDVGYGTRWDRYLFVYMIAMILFITMTTRLKVTWKPLVLIGRASFSLYLFADIFMGIYERILPVNRFGLDSPNLYLFSGIVLACILSLPIYEWFEKPMVSLGKRIIRRLEYPQKSAVGSRSGKGYVTGAQH